MAGGEDDIDVVFKASTAQALQDQAKYWGMTEEQAKRASERMVRMEEKKAARIGALQKSLASSQARMGIGNVGGRENARRVMEQQARAFQGLTGASGRGLKDIPGINWGKMAPYKAPSLLDTKGRGLMQTASGLTAPLRIALVGGAGLGLLIAAMLAIQVILQNAFMMFNKIWMGILKVLGLMLKPIVDIFAIALMPLLFAFLPLIKIMTTIFKPIQQAVMTFFKQKIAAAKDAGVVLTPSDMLGIGVASLGLALSLTLVEVIKLIGVSIISIVQGAMKMLVSIFEIMMRLTALIGWSIVSMIGSALIKIIGLLGGWTGLNEAALQKWFNEDVIGAGAAGMDAKISEMFNAMRAGVDVAGNALSGTLNFALEGVVSLITGAVIPTSTQLTEKLNSAAASTKILSSSLVPYNTNVSKCDSSIASCTTTMASFIQKVRQLRSEMLGGSGSGSGSSGAYTPITSLWNTGTGQTIPPSTGGSSGSTPGSSESWNLQRFQQAQVEWWSATYAQSQGGMNRPYISPRDVFTGATAWASTPFGMEVLNDFYSRFPELVGKITSASGPTLTDFPGLKNGGFVERTGMAVVHSGETYSGVNGTGSDFNLNLKLDASNVQSALERAIASVLSEKLPGIVEKEMREQLSRRMR